MWAVKRFWLCFRSSGFGLFLTEDDDLRVWTGDTDFGRCRLRLLVECSMLSVAVDAFSRAGDCPVGWLMLRRFGGGARDVVEVVWPAFESDSVVME